MRLHCSIHKVRLFAVHTLCLLRLFVAAEMQETFYRWFMRIADRYLPPELVSLAVQYFTDRGHFARDFGSGLWSALAEKLQMWRSLPVRLARHVAMRALHTFGPALLHQNGYLFDLLMNGGSGVFGTRGYGGGGMYNAGVGGLQGYGSYSPYWPT